MPSNLKMKSKFLVTIGFILLVNTSNAQQPSVSHANLSEVETYGPIKPEEVLWTIAKRLHFDQSISRHQIVLARFKLNPHAFHKLCNINTLKTGAILQVPSLRVIEVIDHTYAIQEIKKQETQWHHRKIQPVSCSQLRLLELPPQKRLCETQQRCKYAKHDRSATPRKFSYDRVRCLTPRNICQIATGQNFGDLSSGRAHGFRTTGAKRSAECCD
jgi:FimV-like protein